MREQTLAAQRPILFRYALLQLRDSTLADDAVQDTLLAALQSPSNFKGNSGLRTWLIGILKHKIADHWRRQGRETTISAFEPVDSHDDDADLDIDAFFIGDGHWNGGPKVWSDPEAALKQQEFWAVYELCHNNLPPKLAKIFMLRELVGLAAEEVCQETGISEANYWVCMHRARLRLRECLELRWFNHAK
ncbi:sigma-70 family RNA polymerase sigma factor [Methylomonas montana]|uniref:sigma-70 family RNA polymerase sigma factor n=1 Tax=Methylomonas montana TaxID=3058963 RepID=UPI002659D5C7|nr:sigma-70 family RNA polymerase sigma factor [Methylomonas montana]WKJ90274.1 sigma-70 family RNA polymerase sigma factor [Methylomonas montana]